MPSTKDVLINKTLVLLMYEYSKLGSKCNFWT